MSEDEARGLLTPNVRSDDEGFYRNWRERRLEVDTAEFVLLLWFLDFVFFDKRW